MDDISNLEFSREIEVESSNTELSLLQYSSGDVGCVVWDAGIVLGKYLDHKHKSLNSLVGKSVIDLGSGTGVAGLFAAALGANVVLTDLPEVIPLLQKNIKRNDHVIAGSAEASVLVWGESETKCQVPDLILVSDCIYYEKSVEELIPTLKDLTNLETEVIISYEDRASEHKKTLLKQFLEALGQSFYVEAIPSISQHPHFQSPDIYLLHCKKKSI